MSRLSIKDLPIILSVSCLIYLTSFWCIIFISWIIITEFLRIDRPNKAFKFMWLWFAYLIVDPFLAIVDCQTMQIMADLGFGTGIERYRKVMFVKTTCSKRSKKCFLTTSTTVNMFHRQT